MWNYRIVGEHTGEGVYAYHVCEVYYNEDGKPHSRCRAELMGNTAEECLNDLKAIDRDINQPSLLWPDDFVKADFDKEKTN